MHTFTSMSVPILYIGVAQSIFAAIVIFIKRPLSIADKILGSWLLLIGHLFLTSIIENSIPEIKGGAWVITLNILIVFPPFLYLYSKYVTGHYLRFKITDLFHFIPVLLCTILILIYRDPMKGNFADSVNYFTNLKWLRNLIGVIFIVTILVYGGLASYKVHRYKKNIVNIYSYESGKNSLTWLQLVVITFMVTFSLIVILGSLKEQWGINIDVSVFQDVGLIFFVYAVSFWGYRQNQIIGDMTPTLDNAFQESIEKPKTGKYKKSGLKEDDVDDYIKKITNYMSVSEAWMNPELSVVDVSQHTLIPKHYIAQILNEKLNKNFNTFVNEYRTKRAMELLISKEYSHYSMVAIAYECGFNSKTAFNIFFKKYTGKTPSQFNKS